MAIKEQQTYSGHNEIIRASFIEEVYPLAGIEFVSSEVRDEIVVAEVLKVYNYERE